MTMQQSSRQARAASRQARLYGDSQPAQLTILNAPSHGSHGRIWPRPAERHGECSGIKARDGERPPLIKRAVTQQVIKQGAKV